MNTPTPVLSAPVVLWLSAMLLACQVPEPKSEAKPEAKPEAATTEEAPPPKPVNTAALEREVVRLQQLERRVRDVNERIKTMTPRLKALRSADELTRGRAHGVEGIRKAAEAGLEDVRLVGVRANGTHWQATVQTKEKDMARAWGAALSGALTISQPEPQWVAEGRHLWTLSFAFPNPSAYRAEPGGALVPPGAPPTPPAPGARRAKELQLQIHTLKAQTSMPQLLEARRRFQSTESELTALEKRLVPADGTSPGLLATGCADAAGLALVELGEDEQTLLGGLAVTRASLAASGRLPQLQATVSCLAVAGMVIGELAFSDPKGKGQFVLGIDTYTVRR